jgi:hypothetical protein
MLVRRRGILLGALGAPFLAGCFYPRFFDISWEEEVQLHDGRVIVVKLKYEYERLGAFGRFSKYGNAMLRDSELTFESSSGSTIKQILKRQRPLLLDQKEGRWYLVIEQVSGMTGIEAGQDWGIDQNGHGQRVAELIGSAFVPSSIAKLPSEFSTPNFLYDYAPVAELVLFDRTRVTLAQKREYVARYPLSKSHKRIERPRR